MISWIIRNHFLGGDYKFQKYPQSNFKLRLEPLNFENINDLLKYQNPSATVNPTSLSLSLTPSSAPALTNNDAPKTQVAAVPSPELNTTAPSATVKTAQADVIPQCDDLELPISKKGNEIIDLEAIINKKCSSYRKNMMLEDRAMYCMRSGNQNSLSRCYCDDIGLRIVFSHGKYKCQDPEDLKDRSSSSRGSSSRSWVKPALIFAGVLSFLFLIYYITGINNKNVMDYQNNIMNSYTVPTIAPLIAPPSGRNGAY